MVVPAAATNRPQLTDPDPLVSSTTGEPANPGCVVPSTVNGSAARLGRVGPDVVFAPGDVPRTGLGSAGAWGPLLSPGRRATSLLLQPNYVGNCSLARRRTAGQILRPRFPEIPSAL